ncbi:hypothetical protein HYS91_02290 [Candidatus Daviesbacteria bacterium]|nr:hypothetical protein [Candidatus Daviesbacteria bacterium]
MADETQPIPPPPSFDSEVDQVRFSERRINLTKTVLKEIFPRKSFQVLSNPWSTSVVWIEEGVDDRVYKVGIPYAYNPKFKKEDDWQNWYQNFRRFSQETTLEIEEARKIKLLNGYGLAPQLHLYVPVEDSLNGVEGKVRPRVINPIVENTQIPISLTKGRLPVIIMERVDYDENGVYGLPIDMRMQWVEQTFGILERLKLYPADSEAVYDKKNQRIVFIDLGGMSTDFAGNDRYTPLREELEYKVKGLNPAS